MPDGSLKRKFSLPKLGDSLKAVSQCRYIRKRHSVSGSAALVEANNHNEMTNNNNEDDDMSGSMEEDESNNNDDNEYEGRDSSLTFRANSNSRVDYYYSCNNRMSGEMKRRGSIVLDSRHSPRVVSSKSIDY